MADKTFKVIRRFVRDGKAFEPERTVGKEKLPADTVTTEQVGDEDYAAYLVAEGHLEEIVPSSKGKVAPDA
jgi:hypothetical protein